jgi:phospholipid/cholesterol/gamma-HCH transport system substrate-binding protein
MEQDKGLEFKVGVFVIFALLVVAALMMVIGRVGDLWTPSFTVAVQFDNADGLLKGATVNLAGAPVGKVKTSPHPLDDGRGVSVIMKIYKSAKIRQDSRFRIAEVGMLGDRDIEIDPSPDPNAPLLEDGAVIRGDRSPGLAGLTEAAQPVMDRLGEVSKKLDTIATKIDRDILTPETSADLRESIKRLRSVLTRTDALLAEAQQGKGAVGVLLRDPKTANDLTAFISNLRRKGILFYSDAASKEGKPERDR